MRQTLCMLAGIVGSMISNAFGGWDTAMATLVIFMAVDYITGLVVAGVFHRSGKSESGSLDSRAGFKGLCRKGGVLLLVLVATRVDLVLGVDFVRDAVCIGFTANELLSILENAGLMGIPIPKVLTKAIDVLQSKTEVDE